MTSPSRRLVISTLGLTQIFSWGSSYYLLAVLAKPIAAETGWTLSLVVTGLSLGLLSAGLVSPRVGRIIEARGGRSTLAASSFLLGLGLALLSGAHHPAVYVLAWLVIGVGMGAGLYDAAFATLGRAYGSEARSAITSLTLWGGFASTVCWPISAYLVESIGWRGACLVYAAVQLGCSMPLHWLLMPRLKVRPTTSGPITTPVVRLKPEQRRAFMLFAILVTSTGAIASLVSVHLLTFLQTRGIELAAAVALGALIGPSQVGSRIVEMAWGRRFHPIWTLTAAASLIAAGVVALACDLPLLAGALMLYGAGNGIWSIARGTFPLAVFGASGYPTLMGKVALPGLLAQALSPALAALLLDHSGTDVVLALTAGLAVVNVAITAMLWSAVQRAGGWWSTRRGDRDGRRNQGSDPRFRLAFRPGSDISSLCPDLSTNRRRSKGSGPWRSRRASQPFATCWRRIPKVCPPAKSRGAATCRTTRCRPISASWAAPG